MVNPALLRPTLEQIMIHVLTFRYILFCVHHKNTFSQTFSTFLITSKSPDFSRFFPVGGNLGYNVNKRTKTKRRTEVTAHKLSCQSMRRDVDDNDRPVTEVECAGLKYTDCSSD